MFGLSETKYIKPFMIFRFNYKNPIMISSGMIILVTDCEESKGYVQV